MLGSVVLPKYGPPRFKHTVSRKYKRVQYAGVVELVDASDLGSDPRGYGFESLRSHHWFVGFSSIAKKSLNSSTDT